MFWEYPLIVKCLDTATNAEYEKTFNTKEEHTKYIQDQFKVPGKYNLKNTKRWQDSGNIYRASQKKTGRPNFEGGRYVEAPKDSFKEIQYFKNEKEKVKNGVIIDGLYIPPFYYWYLNFCPIVDAVKKKKDFGQVWDSDFWFFQYIMLCLLIGKHAVVVKARQRGYFQPYSELVLAKEGWVEMGSLNIGSEIYTPAGTLTTVTEIFEHPNQDVYELILKDGRKVKCGLEHLWRVIDKQNKSKKKIMSLQDLLNSNLTNSVTAPLKSGELKKYDAYRYCIEEIQPIQFEKKELLIPPYVMGCILGDGSTSKHQIRISSNDDFILDEIIKELGEEYEYGNSDKRTDSTVKRMSIKYKEKFSEKNKHFDNSEKGVNPICRYFKHYNLHDKNTYSKFIPKDYLFSSVEDRIALLQGLMDTDGFISEKGYDIQYTTCSKELSDNVAHLTRSLGLTTSISTFPASEKNSVYYRVRIKPTTFSVFRLPRKLQRLNLKRDRFTSVPIVGIKKLDYKEDSRCITVSDSDHMYITRDFVPTHNTLKIMAILYWSYCWFETSVNTIGASKEDYVLKSWRFLEFYRKHINDYTRWIRGPVLPKSLLWEEKTQTDDGSTFGLDSKLSGTTFKTSPENGVGGSQTIFFYEEAGIAPTLLLTVGYVRPALERGNKVTGLIICSGAVGELDDAEDLKSIFYDPEAHNFLSVPNIWDDNENYGQPCGLFVSEAYNLEGFIDEEGNSLVEKATEYVENFNKEVTSKKKKELAQLDTSQKPLSPKSAFSERKSSEFPIDKLRKQQERILLKDKENKWDFKPLKGLFEENSEGKVILNTKAGGPEHRYPIDPTWEDKRGVWTLYQPLPAEIPEKYTFFAAVDAIEVDITETSKSIASIDIFQTQIHVEYLDEKGVKKTRIEGDKLVATYRGRFDTAKQTNEQMWLGIKVFNAWCYPERNKPNFINYMREMGRAEIYLAKESDVPLFKDLNIKNGLLSNNSKFGFHKGKNDEVTELWKNFKSQAKEYFFSEYSRVSFENKEGVEEVIKVFTGIDRIDDYWLLEELCTYVEINGKTKGNYDRLVSFFGALFICKVYQQNRYIKRKSEVIEKAKQQIYTPPKQINMLGGKIQNYLPKKSRSMLG